MTAKRISLWRRPAGDLRLTLCVTLLLLPSERGGAGDLMRIEAIRDGQRVTVGSSSLLNLLEAAIKVQDQFQALSGLDRTLTLTYAGVPNAAIVSINAAGTEAVLKLPSYWL